MEQDRAPHVLPHHAELARATIGKSRSHHQSDRQHHHQAGLKIRAELDRGIYPIGLKITDTELSELNLKLAKFNGDWNYSLLPPRKKY